MMAASLEKQGEAPSSAVRKKLMQKDMGWGFQKKKGECSGMAISPKVTAMNLLGWTRKRKSVGVRSRTNSKQNK